MEERNGCDIAEIAELQNSIIEWQKHIIGELMRLYSTESEFHIPEELQEQIQEVKEMYRRLNTP